MARAFEPLQDAVAGVRGTEMVLMAADAGDAQAAAPCDGGDERSAAVTTG